MDGIFDELYVISDLHIGGRVDPKTGLSFQLFDHGVELGATLQRLAQERAGHHVAIVLNGDIFDFLAEAADLPGPPTRYLFPDEAEQWVYRIAADPAFRPVFSGLKAVVDTPGFVLVIVLGNHDIELHLPRVQAALLDTLDATAEPRRGRVDFATDGGGWRAQVGAASVLCTHGDRSDPANVVDQDALRRQARDQRDERPPPPWDPSPGHVMVLHVVNVIKRSYPFFDLFQPQDFRMLPVTTLVDPAMLARIPRAAQVYIDTERGRRTLDLMGAPTGGAAEPIHPVLDVLDEVRDVDPLDLVGEEGTLGFREWLRGVADWVAGTSPARTILSRWLKDHDDSKLDTDDECSLWVKKTIGDVDFVVCGHTHVRKVMERPGGFYFNSGSWIPLLRLDAAHVATADKARETLERLRTPDRCTLSDMLARERTVVRFRVAGGRTEGCLMDAAPDGSLTAVAHTGRVR